jgi:tRNA/tmRNA/rRNA uracil-C5-methylase (TrmA/RlmC/RlmD family)
VVPVDDCLVAAPGAVEPSGGSVVETVATRYGSHELTVAADGFWQPHREAPRVLVETVLDMLAPRTGERVLDLYSGVGLFARFLADAVGPAGRVVAVEGDRVACRHAEANLAGAPCAVSVVPGGVETVLAGGQGGEQVGEVDLVVLDPPRQGARRAVVGHVVRRRPRAVAYVACDPAALARDLRTFADLGYRLADLRAFDLFPMTSHVECVAQLVKSGSGLRS